MRLMCIEVEKDDDRQRPFFTFTLYRIYHVWQNAVNQPCVTDDDGNSWRLLRRPDGIYKPVIATWFKRVAFIEIPE